MSFAKIAAVLAVAIVLTSCASATIILFSAEMSGNQISPAVDTEFTGATYASYDSNMFTITINRLWTDIPFDNITLVTVQLGAGGVNGPALFNVTQNNPSNTAYTRDVTVGPLSVSQERALLRGGMYVSIQTTSNPDGEVRGQLVQDGPQRFSSKLLQKNATLEEELAAEQSASNRTVCTFQYSNHTSQMYPTRFFSTIPLSSILSVDIVDNEAPESDEPVFSLALATPDENGEAPDGTIIDMDQVFNLAAWDSHKLYAGRLACRVTLNNENATQWQGTLKFVENECAFNALLTGFDGNPLLDGISANSFNNVTKEVLSMFTGQRLGDENTTSVDYVVGKPRQGANEAIIFAWNSTANSLNSTVPSNVYFGVNPTQEAELLAENVAVIINSIEEPNGHLGGQLLAPTEVIEFYAIMNASNTIPSNEGQNDYYGVMYAVYDNQSHLMVVETFRSNVPIADVTHAGLRRGSIDSNGDPKNEDAVTISEGVAPNVTLYSDQPWFLYQEEHEALFAGNMYAFIATSDFPNGTIRGQVQMIPSNSSRPQLGSFLGFPISLVKSVFNPFPTCE
eukprot:Opistho-2@54881